MENVQLTNCIAIEKLFKWIIFMSFVWQIQLTVSLDHPVAASSLSFFTLKDPTANNGHISFWKQAKDSAIVMHHIIRPWQKKETSALHCV